MAFDLLSKKRLLLTGATGFVGRHVLREALKLGCEVHTFGRADPRVFGSAHWCGDITDCSSVQRAVDGCKPGVVIHLAAAGVGHGSNSLDELLRVNRTGLLLLLSALRLSAECPLVICAGSGYEYNPLGRPLVETDAVGGVNAYGVSKLAGMKIAEEFAQFFHLYWIRLFNIYGPGEFEGRLAPYVIHQVRRGLPVELTPGEQIRDYIHVADVARELLRLAAREGLGSRGLNVYNLGSGHVVTMRRFVENLGLALLTRGLRPNFHFGARSYRDSEPMCYLPDLRRWNSSFGVSKRVELDTGLVEMVELAIDGGLSYSY